MSDFDTPQEPTFGSAADQPLGETLGQPFGEPLTETLDTSTPDAAPGRGKRGWIIGGAVAAVTVAGAGAYAVTTFLGGGADVAEALPADTLGFVSVDLDPGGKQSIEAFRTMRKFPSLKDSLNKDLGDDLKAQLFDAINANGDCKLDYQKDLAPWMGNTAAIGALDGGDANPLPFVVLEVSDEKAAPAGLKKLAACGDTDPGEENWVVADGWATLAETQKDAKKVVGAVAKGTLADNTEYKKWSEELGDKGIVNVYAAPDAAQAMVDAVNQPGLLDAGAAKDFEGFAATLRFADGGIELEGVGGADKLTETLPAGVGERVGSLPEDTVAVFAAGASPEYWKQQFDDMSERTGSDLNALSEELGITVPDDLVALLGDSIVLSVGGDINIDEIANSRDPSSVPLAITLYGDPDQSEPVLQKLVDGQPEFDGVVGWDRGDDRLVVGPSEAYRQQLLDGSGGLKDSASFTSVVPNGADVVTVFYIDFNGADNWLYTLAKEADPKVAENVDPLSAFGLSATVDGDVAHLMLKVSTD